MNIKITYQIRYSQEVVTSEISPESYFDLEEDEFPNINSVPKYNHVIDYLQLDRDVEKVQLVINDNQKKLVQEEIYWNHNKGRFTNQKIFEGSKLIYEVIITESEIQDRLFHISRIDKNGQDSYKLLHDVLIIENKDGSQGEIMLHKDGIHR